mmetsp:Transcript_17549/g.30110  ORF Transcript_17549/g.30110 Transcript_17549/m.30110 type:complete len:220 (-) Transcript_17549:386-1045(-)|eukprot:CAMPEP_0119103388 /NCGR_PEP_ID=MMETSP1180-20130426/1828_1 /TAXON_ID=3052 ORGANISM="Chlamydomonas cf sp, Strain CCMP681" /NCGR_SAMPLE_ID=MMETSP1180 /ASSEMBLY_ACC=CAM_ASM_000741 /LENGTH=219 /DNA_ID=CAMNT_0007087873 /DNA_START=146 /DNA_END=805 /DNA_ORIENTATION=-
MVFYFTPRNCVEGSQDFLIYMGRDKVENEDLIKYMWPTDCWFHVDDLSSAHVYLRLPDDCTMEQIPADTLEDCVSLVKANSIQGCKQSTVAVVYTMWSNLKKTGAMDVGQVGFHNERAVKRVPIVHKNSDIVKRLERTRREVARPDLAGEKEAYDAQRRNARKAEDRQKRESARTAKVENMKIADQRGYTSVMKNENMTSNRELQGQYKTAEEFEDDFM